MNKTQDKMIKLNRGSTEFRDVQFQIFVGRLMVGAASGVKRERLPTATPHKFTLKETLLIPPPQIFII